MKEKLSLSNTLLNNILEQRENSPTEVFRVNYLKSNHPKCYALLKENNILCEFYKDIEDSTFYDNQGEPYFVVKEESEIYGYPKNRDIIDRVKLENDDVNFVRFEDNNFLNLIKEKNNLTGKIKKITNHLYFLGDYKAKNINICCVLGYFSNDKDVEKEVFAMPSRLPSTVEQILLILPKYEPNIDFLTLLDNKQIHCCNLEHILSDDFIIDFDNVIQDKSKNNFKIPALTTEEKADKEYNYKCQDVIEFLEDKTKYRNISIKINGNKTDVPYAQASLFIFMALKLKDNKDGYVSAEECEKEGITQRKEEESDEPISPSYLHNLVSKLRKTLKNYASNGLIENLKHKKKYRISTYSSRIKEPSKNWLKNIYKKIMKEIKEERKTRDGWTGK